MGELALIDNSSALSVAGELPAIFQLARALKDARGFLPAHLQTEGQIVAVIMAGRELGIPPMAAIRSISLVQGRVTLDAALQLGLMARAGARWAWLKDGSDGEAVLRLERPGYPAHESRYTVQMATAAGLIGKDIWKKHRDAMLRARCVTAAGKTYMPDVLAGVYLPDELDDAREPAQVVEVRQVERVEAVQAQEAHEAAPVALPRATSAELAAAALAALAGARTLAELDAIEQGVRGEWAAYSAGDKRKLKAAKEEARKRLDTNADWGMGNDAAPAAESVVE